MCTKSQSIPSHYTISVPGLTRPLYPGITWDFLGHSSYLYHLWSLVQHVLWVSRSPGTSQNISSPHTTRVPGLTCPLCTGIIWDFPDVLSHYTISGHLSNMSSGSWNYLGLPRMSTPTVPRSVGMPRDILGYART